MDIDAIIISEGKKAIAAKLGCNGELGISDSHSFVGRRVIVRSYASGVHFGTLKACTGKDVYLTDSRRIWQWEGAFTLSAVSQEGITKGKLSCITPEIYLPDTCEVIPCTEKAAKKLDSVKDHTA